MRGVAALALALVSCHAPAPRADVPAFEDDYPLETGLRWTYRGALAVSVTREIRGTREIEGRTYHEMTFILPLSGTHVLPMRRTPEGVVTWRAGREHLLMRFPMRAGDRWTIDLPGEAEVAECEVAGDEDVEALGRRLRATRLRVERRRRDGTPAGVDTEWYARGIGLVRMEVTYGVRATFALNRFERGGN